MFYGSDVEVHLNKLTEILINSKISKFASANNKTDIEKILKSEGIKSIPEQKNMYSYNEVASYMRGLNPMPPLKKHISMITQKGGVGKTTNAYTIGNYLSILGYKVLFVDLDAQCNLTEQFLSEEDYNIHSPDNSIFEVLRSERSVEECIFSIRENIDLIPGYSRFETWQNGLSSHKYETVFSRVFLNKLKDEYDYVIFDNHSADNYATNSTMKLDGLVISVVEPDAFSVRGIEPIRGSVEFLNEECGASTIYKILVNNVDKKSKAHEHYIEEILENYEDEVFDNFICNSQDFVNSNSFKLPIYAFKNFNSNASRDYIGLIGELIETTTQVDSFNMSAEGVNHANF